ncbi:hypothetical protein CC1G_14873 [Coprinopsis cinerea okayama7|uniref:Uncharacterized protein n=1 Tax=Coprinopsis cinerea (strain Okayama-7 / 130 / ATCC MYA-4618 / FGSC 9003) TaxID=240176 RepID=D6RNX8_COPC7|nr:hypothetical protein CC1G_14873 [Coprinopsis cinerea okayama7\|eukprot:XP_002910896.1 hypothetical protein CC1G_14873 [Coprinopsis cinerea okayama7\
MSGSSEICLKAAGPCEHTSQPRAHKLTDAAEATQRMVDELHAMLGASVSEKVDKFDHSFVFWWNRRIYQDRGYRIREPENDVSAVTAQCREEGKT